MQKQEIPPLTLCHSGSDLALNQLVLLQAISRPPWRLYECSLNSRGSSWTSLHSPYLLGGCCSCSYKQESFHAVQIKAAGMTFVFPLLWGVLSCVVWKVLFHTMEAVQVQHCALCHFVLSTFMCVSAALEENTRILIIIRASIDVNMADVLIVFFYV